MVERLCERFVEPGGRVIVSSYAHPDEGPRPLFEQLTAAGRAPHGTIHIDRPGRHPLRTAWIDC